MSDDKTNSHGQDRERINLGEDYEVRDWTIFFKVDGKVIWSTDFMPLLDDVKDPGTILVETFAFTRE